MNLSKYTVEDFVLDPEFRKWIWHPNPGSNLLWKKLLEENPSKHKEIILARNLLINLNVAEHEVEEEEVKAVWEKIESHISNISVLEPEKKVIPLNAYSTIEQLTQPGPGMSGLKQWHRVAAILALSFGLSYLVNVLVKVDMDPVPPIIVFEEHITPAGVKSNLTLSDGSKVVLNSGSTLKYVKGFDKNKREVILEGEAFFEVSRDLNLPFSVITDKVRTTALGTSFNIQAYPNETMDISLLTGKVAVELVPGKPDSVLLKPGESLKINPGTGLSSLTVFDSELVMAWTKKTIFFNKTPLNKAIRILENWYGVRFELQNQPDADILLSGTYFDESLENVLEGLSYSARLSFSINKDIVNVKFNPQP